MIRIAAAGDVHYDRNSSGKLKKHLSHLEEQADILLLAGDLTQLGHEEEAMALAEDLSESPVPVVAVLGNHDYHSNCVDKVISILHKANVRVLERESMVIDLGHKSIGIVGLKGFGGGFAGACATEFGEPETKAFVRHTKECAEDLKNHLLNLETDYKVALLHYSPIPETLLGEKKEIYPFLGSFLLAEAIDEGGADIAFHGHAHRGTEKGITAGGVPVRNVAQPVIRHMFNIYTLDKERTLTHVGISPSPASPAH